MCEISEDSKYEHRLYFTLKDLASIFATPAGVGAANVFEFRGYDGSFVKFWQSEHFTDDDETKFNLNIEGPGVNLYASLTHTQLLRLQTRLRARL